MEINSLEQSGNPPEELDDDKIQSFIEDHG